MHVRKKTLQGFVGNEDLFRQTFFNQKQFSPDLRTNIFRIAKGKSTNYDRKVVY